MAIVQHPTPDAEIRAQMAKRAEPAPLMTIGDLSKRRKCSNATSWRHVKAGILPAPIKLGGLTRWVPEEVEAAIARAMAARDGGEQ
jgi:predicted DNA-binding transcriptional regulator AlpA